MTAEKFYKIKIEYRHFAGWSYKTPYKSYLSLKWVEEAISKD